MKKEGEERKAEQERIASEADAARLNREEENRIAAAEFEAARIKAEEDIRGMLNNEEDARQALETETKIEKREIAGKRR